MQRNNKNSASNEGYQSREMIDLDTNVKSSISKQSQQRMSNQRASKPDSLTIPHNNTEHI